MVANNRHKLEEKYEREYKDMVVMGRFGYEQFLFSFSFIF